jgi:2-octaprenylphenol hydroxylase
VNGNAAMTDRDVIIVGAGLVGLSLAVALARAGLSVTIVDRGGVATGVSEISDDADDWDQRVYAISPGSAAFLHGLGAWQRLPSERITAIDAMQVHGDADGELFFSAYELGERALAWIVENRALHAALVEAVRVEPSIDVLAPCEPSALVWSKDAVELSVSGRTLSARLVVGADGARSWTREQAGIGETPRSYEQTAVVGNFATEIAHRGRAFQWFLGGRGVLAWLPLPGNRMSMVWSAPVALAAELVALDKQALAWTVAAAGGDALGTLTQITPPASYPLSFLKLASPVADRLVHPLAGQGVNLGFGDAAALASALAVHGIVGDAGAPLLLDRYACRRAESVLAMQWATDGLARLFDSPFPGAKTLRNRGMSAVGAQPLVRRLLAQPALR